MLSEDLQSLADRLSAYRDDGLQLDALGVVAMIALLNAMSADAHALERVAIPVNARLDLARRGDLGPNVLVLPFPAGPTVAIPFGGEVA